MISVVQGGKNMSEITRVALDAMVEIMLLERL